MVVAIGASWGGLYALMELLGALPTDFGAAIAVVQHRMPDQDDERLAGVLARYSALPVSDAEDKQPLEPAHVYLAPADYHLLVEPGHFELSVDDPVHYSRPSIDMLFETAAAAYRAQVVAVLLTGYGRDGAAGLRRVRDGGGITIVQEPASAVQGRLPQAGIDAGGALEVLTLDAIPARLIELCQVVA